MKELSDSSLQGGAASGTRGGSMNPAGGQLRQGMQHKGLYNWQRHCEVWPGPLPQHGGHGIYGIALRRLHCYSQVLKVNELE